MIKRFLNLLFYRHYSSQISKRIEHGPAIFSAFINLYLTHLLFLLSILNFLFFFFDIDLLSLTTFLIMVFLINLFFILYFFFFQNYKELIINETRSDKLNPDRIKKDKLLYTIHGWFCFIIFFFSLFLLWAKNVKLL